MQQSFPNLHSNILELIQHSQFIKLHSQILNLYIIQSFKLLYANRKNLNLHTPKVNQMLTAQTYKSRYYEYFNGWSKYSNLANYETQDNLCKHQIRLLSQQQINKMPTHLQPIIKIKAIQQQGAIVVYSVVLSKFQLEIILINIANTAPSSKDNRKLGNSKTVQVRIEKVNGRQFAVKRCYFHAKDTINRDFMIKVNSHEIQSIIAEVAITKICSLYHIGPAMNMNLGFDILCFNDCIQFHLEICSTQDDEEFIPYNIMKLQQDLKRCLFVLHSLKIIHRDIKPPNVLYSKSYQSFVFIDYGISHPIIQSIGFNTFMKENRGTVNYMIKQLQNLTEQRQINLYENDIYALNITIDQLISKMEINKCRIQKKKQQMQYIYLNPNKYNKIKQNNFQCVEFPSIGQSNADNVYKTQSIQVMKSVKNQMSLDNQNIPNISQSDYQEIRMKMAQKQLKQQLKKRYEIISQKGEGTFNSTRPIEIKLNYEYFKLKYDAMKANRQLQITFYDCLKLSKDQLIQIAEIVYKFGDQHKINKIDYIINNLNLQINHKFKQIQSHKYQFFRRVGFKQKIQMSIKYFDKLEQDIYIKYQDKKSIPAKEMIGLLQQMSDIQMSYQQSKTLNEIQMAVPEVIDESPQSLFRKEYYQEFKDIRNNINFSNYQTQQNLQKHKIRLLEINDYNRQFVCYRKPYINVKYIENRGSVIVYDVIIGKFQLDIVLINFQENAPIRKNIGKGSFGQVRIEKSTGKHFLVKRQYYKEGIYFDRQLGMQANKYEIEEVIKQLSINKICSLYGIGPAVDTSIGFDLLCFNDCIQFHLEVCYNLENKNIIQKLRKDQCLSLYNDIKKCIYILHSLKIIHKDIKPENMLFSKQNKSFVLSDFGLSHTVNQEIGYKSITYKQGTQNYMSEAMKKLGVKQKSTVNLYENDMYAFGKSMKIQKERVRDYVKNFNKYKKHGEQTQVDNLSQFNYHYLKFKYCAIKLNVKLDLREEEFSLLSKEQVFQITKIMSSSTQLSKINEFYEFISKNSIYFENVPQNYIQEIADRASGKMKIQDYIQDYDIQTLKYYIRVYGYNEDSRSIYKKLNLNYNGIERKFNTCIQKETDETERIDQYFSNIVCSKRKIENKIKNLPNSNKVQKFRLYMKLFGIEQNEKNKIQILNMIQQLNYRMNQEERIEYVIYVMRMGIMDKLIKQEFKQISANRSQYIKQTYSHNLAIIYRQLGNYKLAFEYIMYSIQKQKQINNQMHPIFAALFQQTANIYHSMDKYHQSLDYAFKSIQLYKRIYNQIHPQLANLYQLVATIYKITGQYPLALDNCFKSLSISKRLYGEIHPVLADIYSKISMVYNHIGKYALSLNYSIKSAQIYKQVHGQRHPSLSSSYYQISIGYSIMGDYQLALETSLKSLSIWKQMFGQMHPELVSIYQLIAHHYNTLNKYNLALENSLKGIQVGVNYSQDKIQMLYLAYIYHQTAITYRKMKQYQLALHYCDKALLVYNKLYQKDHLSFASIYHQISVIKYQIDQNQAALEYCLKSIAILKQRNNDWHPSLGHCYFQAANVYRKLYNYQQALKYSIENIKIYQYLYTQQSSNLALSYYSAALISYQRSDYESSVKYSIKCEKVCKLKQDHTIILIKKELYNLNSNLYTNIGKQELSIYYSLKCICIMTRLYGRGHIQLGGSYHQLSNLYAHKNEFMDSLNFQLKNLCIKYGLQCINYEDIVLCLSTIGYLNFKINRLIQSHFYFKLSHQISCQHLEKNFVDIKQVCKMIQKIEITMPILVQVNTNHQSFVHDIHFKYKKLQKTQLYKILIAKKRLLTFLVTFRKNQHIDSIKQLFQISLCYKYLNDQIQFKRYILKLKNHCHQLIIPQQKILFQSAINKLYQ